MALSRPTLLVLRALGLGDFLTAVPALRALRKGLPRHRMVLATPATLEPLVRLAAVADELLPTPGLARLPWRGEGPDLAVNLHGRGPQSHELLLELSPRRLVGFASPALGTDGPVWTEEEHEVGRWTRLVVESLGIEADPDDLLLETPDIEPAVRDALLVHPGAAFPSRRWPVERFGSVARWAAGRGMPVVVTGDASERGLGDEVRRLGGLPQDAVLAGRTSLMELSALVSSARLVICGDTGMAHLASAFRTPSVLLFGPTPPTRWGPPHRGPHQVIWHGSADGDPWGDEIDPALEQITVAEVVERADLALRMRAPEDRRAAASTECGT